MLSVRKTGRCPSALVSGINFVQFCIAIVIHQTDPFDVDIDFGRIHPPQKI